MKNKKIRNEFLEDKRNWDLKFATSNLTEDDLLEFYEWGKDDSDIKDILHIKIDNEIWN